jgi:hypothetical protein
MNATLGKPLYKENGKIKEIDSNKKQYTYSANGTMNGIEVIDTGQFVSNGKNAIFDQGDGKITTKDGSEIADYTFTNVVNGKGYEGSLVFGTNSTGKLSFLNDKVVKFKGGYDENGNFEEEGLEV